MIGLECSSTKPPGCTSFRNWLSLLVPGIVLLDLDNNPIRKCFLVFGGWGGSCGETQD